MGGMHTSKVAAAKVAACSLLDPTLEPQVRHTRYQVPSFSPPSPTHPLPCCLSEPLPQLLPLAPPA